MILQDGGDDAAVAARLTEVYDKLSNMGAASADARASKILHGLGFTPVMQVRFKEGVSFHIKKGSECGLKN